MADLIRVLLVDDSGLARSLLRAILEADGGFEVVGEAGNGREAVAMAAQLRPHLVTMDLEMPVMSGLEAIEQIMSSCAAPILVVSSVADAHNAYQAVARGALDAIAKPSLTPEDAAAFCAKARLVSKVRVITHVRALRVPQPAQPVAPPLAPSAEPAGDRVFAIACSTGGPQALARLLPQLTADFPCPVLIAQHISDGFAAGMAEWLSTVSPLRVRVGRDGETLLPGQVYLSPSEANMTLTPSRRIAIVPADTNAIYHPSCDALLTSVAAATGRRCVGVILTGMGRDGVQGIGRIKAAGGITLAQDEDSSVIFGMNRLAVEAGQVTKVLPLDGLAAEMVRLARAPLAAGAPA